MRLRGALVQSSPMIYACGFRPTVCNLSRRNCHLGRARFADDRRDTLLDPALIVEVLSPSTEAYDRGFKSAQYRTVESLEEYALVTQAEPRIEVFRRQPGGHWLLSEAIGLDAVCHFESLDCSIPLAEVFAKVTFSPEDPLASIRPPVRRSDPGTREACEHEA